MKIIRAREEHLDAILEITQQAKKRLEKLGLDIPVAGMVKDDRHRTRGIYYNNVEQPIDTHSESFHLITRIQDETHRFAITYHRNLRSNAQIHSILDDIQGIGDKRRKALMKEFGSIEAVAEATDEELAAAPGMNVRAAKAVRDFFEARKKGNIMRDETPYEPASEPGEDS